MTSVGKLTICCLATVALLVRWLVSQFPYSGQNTPPMYGDYEAQRHWMEITTNLPVKEWYQNTTDNELLYWGLDYPPLTAYHMFILGKTANKFFNSSWTELHKSRGLESLEHKLFMRFTVIISDLIVYLPSIIYYFHNTKPTQYNSPPSTIHRHNLIAYIALTLLYPAQILVDHGHFQYNCIFMGLTLWAIISMLMGKQIISAILFTLALSYKQMSLYYSLPFFWYIAATNIRTKPLWKGLVNIMIVGAIVLLTLVCVFSPYLHSFSSISQVIRRMFPFDRGLFEDKVANVWFSLSIFYKLKTIYPTETLLKASTISTLAASIPTGLFILFKPTIRSFKYALVNTSLAFFLLSFQVHEKTILVPALPLLLLYREHPIAVNWFAIVSTFSLQPLLIRDGQTIPYFVLLIIYTLTSLDIFNNQLSLSKSEISFVRIFSNIMYLVSIFGCILLSFAAILVDPPTKFPHIHPTINSLYSCTHFVLFFFYFYFRQFMPAPYQRLTTQDKTIQAKKTK